MVSPLDVDVVVRHQAVHDAVAVRAAVIDVAHHVQVLDGQALDEHAERADEVVADAVFHDGVNDALVVLVAAHLAGTRGAQELLEDGGVVGGQRLAYVGARVEARDVPREPDQVHERLPVPVGQVEVAPAQLGEPLLGVVDERAEFVFGKVVHGVAEDRLHVLADDARAVVEDVLEGQVLAVDVAHEVLGALGEVELCLKVDDLGVGLAHGGKLTREEAEVAKVLGCGIGWHGCSPLVAGLGHGFGTPVPPMGWACGAALLPAWDRGSEPVSQPTCCHGSLYGNATLMNLRRKVLFRPNTVHVLLIWRARALTGTRRAGHRGQQRVGELRAHVHGPSGITPELQPQREPWLLSRRCRDGRRHGPAE